MHLTILLDILHMPEPRLRKSRIKYTGDLVCLDTNEITTNKNPVGTVNLNLIGSFFVFASLELSSKQAEGAE
jgi:hypothetical protein